MALISTSIPNLINGVSQQPASLRLATQCDVMENFYPSIVEGLVKRPPTENVAQLINGSASETHVHMYNRDANERYVVVAQNGSLKVFDLDGTEKTVATPDGTSYLTAANPQTDFRMITIADYTFVVNRNVAVAMDSATSAVNGAKALVFVKQGGYGQTYKVFVDGVEKASKVTSTSDRTDITTNKIATDLASALVTNLGAGWTVTRKSHVIEITNDGGTPFTVTVEESLSGESLKAINAQVPQFTDLPTVAPDGFITEIIGDNDSEFDNYYVQFTADDGTFSEGYWAETIAPGIQYAFDASTMPHVLVRESDGSFTFKQATWDDRVAGDLDSAPNPSFVGQAIAEITFFRNRLIFLAGQNVVMSESGGYFNFWPSTVTNILDEFPIDIAATHSKVSILRHAIPFNKQLLLFSDQTQFVVGGDEVLSPKTVTVTPTTEFDADQYVRPVGAGHNVYFVTKRGRFSGMREYYVDADAETMDAADVTAHVPQYIPKDLRMMDISSAEDILLTASVDTDSDHEVYLYKYYWQGNQKLQSAWGKWSFGAADQVRGIKFINSEVYLVIQRGTDGLYLEKMNLESGRLDPGAAYVTHLDRRITEVECSSVTYDPAFDKTTYTLPYDVTDDTLVVTRTNGVDVPGVILQVVNRTGNTIEVSGDYSTYNVYIGTPFLAKFRFSELVLKEAAGNSQVAVQSGNIQSRYVLVSYADSGYFDAIVSPLYRDQYTYNFTGRILGSGDNVLGQVAIEDGVFRIPIMANSKEVTVDIQSDSFLPLKLQSAEWEAFYTIRSRRR